MVKKTARGRGRWGEEKTEKGKKERKKEERKTHPRSWMRERLEPCWAMRLFCVHSGSRLCHVARRSARKVRWVGLPTLSHMYVVGAGSAPRCVFCAGKGSRRPAAVSCQCPLLQGGLRPRWPVLIRGGGRLADQTAVLCPGKKTVTPRRGNRVGRYTTRN